jgi:hypothetical protein
VTPSAAILYQTKVTDGSYSVALSAGDLITGVLGLVEMYPGFTISLKQLPNSV